MIVSVTKKKQPVTNEIFKILKTFQGLLWVLILVLMGILAGYYAGHTAGYFLCDRFSLTQMTPSSLPSTKAENEKPEALSSILDQEFTYLDKGSQCYVFLSHDQRYVLKFIRHGRYRTWLKPFHFLPTFLKSPLEQAKKEKNEKLEALFKSFGLAELELKKETGIIWLHLTPSTSSQLAILIDKLGRRYEIDLNKYSFVLQKHGELIFPYLNRLLEQKDEASIKDALSSLFSLLSTRLQKGVADGDPSIIKNAGFLDGEAFFIDIGQFRSINPEEVDKKAVVKPLLKRVEDWVEQNCPSLLPFYMQKLEEI